MKNNLLKLVEESVLRLKLKSTIFKIERWSEKSGIMTPEKLGLSYIGHNQDVDNYLKLVGKACKFRINTYNERVENIVAQYFKFRKQTG